MPLFSFTLVWARRASIRKNQQKASLKEVDLEQWTYAILEDFMILTKETNRTNKATEQKKTTTKGKRSMGSKC